MANQQEIRKLAMIGCGSMGGGMALLFAEHGVTVLLNDPSDETVNSVLESGKKQGLQDKLDKHGSYDDLCKGLDSPKVFVFSLPHGKVGDAVIEGLHPYLERGDIIIDAANEDWNNTQRRQGALIAQGVHYVGMGVSGGYQSARRGPSMCPGGDEKAVDLVMPLLQKVAAKDGKGKPCVGKVGLGGAGHYVKMIHNGIEHGMMSAIAEVWQIMNHGLEMSYDEIGDVFAKWNSEGELRGTFLIDIGAHINKQKDKTGHHVLSSVQDKVVQDVDGSEGTGVWSNMESVRLHIPAPTLAAAHFIRLASADRAQRLHVKNTIDGSFKPEKLHLTNDKERQAFLEDLRVATYVACLASFVQGMNIIDAIDRENKWCIDFLTVIQIWRAGCIIQADHIADMLEEIWKIDGKAENRNLLYNDRVARELKNGVSSLRKVVAKGVESNAVIPSLSATLEYLKFSANTDLPTKFYEAEMDYFGKHMFDLTSEPAGDPVKGRHHFEWQPARNRRDPSL